MRMWQSSLAVPAFFLAASLVHAQATGGIGAGSGIGSGKSIGATSGGGGMGFSGGSGFAGGGGAPGGAAPGGTGFTGGAGTTTGRTTTGAGTTTIVPTISNPFRNTYSNPQAIGLTGAATVFSYSPTPPASKGFGQPLYAATTTPGVGATGLGTGLGGGLDGAATDSTGSFTTLGIRRAPAYITTLADDMPRVNHDYAKMQVDLKAALDRSSHLKDKKIDVVVAGSTVVLKGRVASARDRRLVEGMVRLTPGVRDVQNELTVDAKK